MQWATPTGISSKNYSCGYCGNLVASDKGWHAYTIPGRNDIYGTIYICPHCGNPTYFNRANQQIPGVPFGAPISGINEKKIEDLYNEARRAFSASCFTSVVLCCRKLLMHLAVNQGADQGLSFFDYVDFLDANHYVPQGTRPWIDKIREKGNEANHEIVLMTQPEAENIISFSEMLLKILYEFPFKVK